MIVAFVTLLLGLTAGVRTVEVTAAEPVARIEMLLDGAAVGVLTGEPWSLAVDLGDELEPHHLVAIAHGRDGAELGRAEQWLNLPRQAAEAQLLLSGRPGRGPRTARLVWSAAGQGAPETLSVTFDGEPLPIEHPGRIPLPDYDPREPHFLRAELRFAGSVEAVAEAAFGGLFGEQVATELQAVAVTLEGDARLPPAAELSHWLSSHDQPLSVQAVVDGPAEVVLVVDLAARDALVHLRRSNLVRHAKPSRRRPRPDPNLPGFTPQSTQAPGSRALVTERVAIPPGLHRGDRLRFVTPLATLGPRARDPYLIFPVSEPFTSKIGGLFPMMTAVTLPVEEATAQRLADAVAVAGIQAYSSHRRRIVVLVVGDDPIDRSRWQLPAVRRYLAQLRVPLAVWSIGQLAREIADRSPGEGNEGSDGGALPILTTGDLGPVIEISSVKGLKSAIAALRRELAHQRILWLDGHHLPQQMSLAPTAVDVRWAGEH